MSQIVVIGALDTKGAEVEFVTRQIEAHGHQVAVMDVGVLGAPAFPAAISREEVASAAGSTLAALVAANDRGHAISVMRDGAVAMMTRLHRERLVDAVIGLGGG